MKARLLSLSLVLLCLAGCCSRPSPCEDAENSTAVLGVSRLPPGYPRHGIVTPWNTRLAELPWLAVVSESGTRKTAAPIPVSEHAIVREMPETFVFVDDALEEVRVFAAYDLPEQALRIQIENLTADYGDPTVRQTLDGEEYLWSSKETTVNVSLKPWKHSTVRLITRWRKAN